MTAKSAKVEVSKGFTFTPDDKAFTDSWTVSYYPQDERGKDLKDPVALGCITKSSSGRFCILNLGGGWRELWNSKQYAANFETKELAAWALMVMYETVQANPLEIKVRKFLEQRGRHLEEEVSGVTKKMYALQREQYELQILANQYGLNFDFNVDIHKETAVLVEFMNDNIDDIYKKLGKDFARSLAVRIRNIVNLVDIQAAEKLSW